MNIFKTIVDQEEVTPVKTQISTHSVNPTKNYSNRTRKKGIWR